MERLTERHNVLFEYRTVYDGTLHKKYIDSLHKKVGA